MTTIPVRHYAHPGVHIKVSTCALCHLRCVTWRKPECAKGLNARYCVSCIRAKRVRAVGRAA